MKQRESKIQVRELSKHFSDLVVLDQLNFDIYKGEFLCVVGPTGCGKTTFCNVVTNLLPPTMGQVTVDHAPINYKTHNISFVFQAPSCLPWRTVYDNVKIGLEIKSVPSKEIKERVADVLDLTGLTPVKDFFPSQISAGMKQRVAIARGFVTEPGPAPYGRTLWPARHPDPLPYRKLSDQIVGTQKADYHFRYP